MSLKSIKSRLTILIVFYIFFLLFVAEYGMCEPTIKIVYPSDGTVVHPGDAITVRVEAVDGFDISFGYIVCRGFGKVFVSLPATFDMQVPKEVYNKFGVGVVAQDKQGKAVVDDIDFIVEQTADLTSLDLGDFEGMWFETDWDGNVNPDDEDHLYVYGVFSDGVERDIPEDAVTYSSSDSSIAVVDEKGVVKPKGLGNAVITVSKGDVSATMNVYVDEPRGIRPDETIPPTTQITIDPPANAAGWHNTDVNVTITAQDNEGGSGIQEIIYILNSLGADEHYVSGNIAHIILSKEGYDRLNYGAKDNERNGSIPQTVEFHLDKTPPETTYYLSPAPNEAGYFDTLPVTVQFDATDNLSGVAYAPTPVTITEEGSHSIEYFSTDVAGNVEKKKTVVVNVQLSNKDNTPPDITLTLTPRQYLFFTLYQLNYSATDAGSSVETLTAGLLLPDITGYTPILKKSRITRLILLENKQKLIIYAPDPDTLLARIKQGLFSLDNNCLLHLKERSRHGIWKITSFKKLLFIQAPSITFKAQAADTAGNEATKTIEFDK